MTGTLTIIKPKLEISHVATDWTPAHEDQDAATATAANAAADAASAASAAQSTANSAQSTADELATDSTQILRGTNTITALGNGAWSNGSWRQAGTGTGTRTVIDVTGAPNASIKKGFRYVSTVAGDDSIGQDDVPLTAGETYTVSCYARGTGKLVMAVGRGTQSKHTYTVTSAWVRYSGSFVAGTEASLLENGVTSVYFANLAVGTMEVCGMKVEVGDAAKAAKTATNYMSMQDGVGLIVGDMTASTLGNNVLIDSDSVDIRNGSTVLASYGASTVELGKNSTSSVIKMAGGKAQVGHSVTSPLGEASPGVYLQSSGSDSVNVVAPGAGYVRLIGNSSNLKSHAAVILGGGGLQLAVGDGSSESTGSGGYLSLGSGSLSMAADAINILLTGSGAIQCGLAPFQVHGITVYNSASKSLATSWAQVVCGTLKGRSGTLLSVSSGGILCNRAGKVMVCAQTSVSNASGSSLGVRVLRSSKGVAASASLVAPSGNAQLSVAPAIVEVAAGELITLQAANWSSAAGSIPQGDTTYISAWYVE